MQAFKHVLDMTGVKSGGTEGAIFLLNFSWQQVSRNGSKNVRNLIQTALKWLFFEKNFKIRLAAGEKPSDPMTSRQ